MTEIELKPCPCGGGVPYVEGSNIAMPLSGGSSVQIGCDRCWALVVYKGDRLTRQMWNACVDVLEREGK